MASRKPLEIILFRLVFFIKEEVSLKNAGSSKENYLQGEGAPTTLALCLWFALGALALSCESKYKAEKGPETPAQKPRSSQSGDGASTSQSECKTLEALEIFQDGKTIVSRLKENSWMAWTLDGKERVASSLPLNYYGVSPSGDYVLTRVGKTKYQLLELREAQYAHNTFFHIFSSKKPMMRFSPDSKFLIVLHQPHTSKFLDQIDVYDIEKAQIIKSFRARGVKHVSIADSNKSLVVGYELGSEKRIVKYDLASWDEIFNLKLAPYLPFNKMEVAGERLIAKSGNHYFFFDIQNGESLYNGSFEHLYAIDPAHRYALVSKSWEEISIIDIQDGSEIFSGLNPKGALLSSCRLSSEPLTLVCRSEIEQNKILAIEIISGESSLKCY